MSEKFDKNALTGYKNHSNSFDLNEVIRLTKGIRVMLFYKHLKARSSVGERFLDTEEVRGSIPLAPTMNIKPQNKSKVTDKHNSKQKRFCYPFRRGQDRILFNVDSPCPLCCYSDKMSISTLLFLALPSFVLLSATGFVSP